MKWRWAELANYGKGQGKKVGVMSRPLIGLHTFVGIGALFGGVAALLNPYEPLGMPVEALEYSPFDNYLIPGIILLTIVGLGSIISALMLYSGSRFRGCVSAIFSWALVIWIVVQWANRSHFVNGNYVEASVISCQRDYSDFPREESIPLVGSSLSTRGCFADPVLLPGAAGNCALLRE